MIADQNSAQKEIRKYLLVFAVLLSLTLMNVFISRLHLNITLTIIIVLSVAALEASLVACQLMHLISEEKLIYSFLVLTVIFFVFALFIPLWGIFNPITGSTHVP